MGAVPRDFLARARKLRWYQQSGAGVDWMLERAAFRQRPITVTTGSEIRSNPVAEHILAFMLTFARSFWRAHRAQQEREWLKPEYDQVLEMAGKMVLLLGLGGIGSRVAALARAFSMKVTGIRRNSDR